MAAASYYQGAPAQPGPYEMPTQYPAPPPKQQQPQQYPPSAYSEGPPPYSPGLGVPQTQRPPPPPPLQQQQQRPPPQGSNSYYASPPTPYPPPPPQQYPQTPTPRQQYPPYQPYQPPPNSTAHPQQYLQPQPYPPPGAYPPPRNAQSPGYQRRHSASAGYSSDPEDERRHHHRRPHTKRPHSRDERPKASSKGSSRNGILGATGGALLGDLIFPGLGTTVVGGLAGWYAGKKVDKADKGTSYEQRQRQRH
ncbi:hypothetical protein MMC27_007746 [Xylographa pallens]|nr:hypothetical protein [Xylographa pallens]